MEMRIQGTFSYYAIESGGARRVIESAREARQHAKNESVANGVAVLFVGIGRVIAGTQVIDRTDEVRMTTYVNGGAVRERRAA